MGESCRPFTSSSRYLKVATAILMAALIMHIVGFSTPNWSTMTFLDIDNETILQEIPASIHHGLWQICECFEYFGNKECYCAGRHGDPVPIKIIQTLETIALIGLIISGFISMILLCSRQDRNLKLINVFINIGSGICGVVGIIIAAIRTDIAKKNTEEFEADITDKGKNVTEHYHDQVHIYVDFSFYLCCISVLLYVLVCAPLYIKDKRVPIPSSTQELAVVYNNQGIIIIPNELQGTAIITGTGRENAGYIPPPIPQPPFCPPPAYNVDGRQDQTDSQRFQSNDGIPFKE